MAEQAHTADFDELIARLEKATGPDRELDALIAAALGILDDFNPSDYIVAPAYRVSDDGLRVEAWTQIGKLDPWRQASRAPSKFTASIDAALALVPEGYDWFVASVNGYVGGTPYACVGSTKENFGETPVLSLCIAALKARAAIARATSSPSHGKADPFTLESLIAWLEKMPAGETYSFMSVFNCLLAQYARAVGYRWVMMGGYSFSHGFLWLRSTHLPEGFSNISADGQRTFGAALERARALQARSGE